MKLSDFDYHLPDNLIATHPASPRDHSRLLVLDKKTGEIEHKYFYDIVDYLDKGDTLVVNNSKVIPARLFAKKETGGKVEVLLHKKHQSPHGETLMGHEIWECMLGGRVKEGMKLFFQTEKTDSFLRQTQDRLLVFRMTKNSLVAEVLKNNEDGTWNLKFNKKGKELMDILGKLGEVPLPPYILNQRILRQAQDRQREKEMSSRGAKRHGDLGKSSKNEIAYPFAQSYGGTRSLPLAMTEGADKKDYQTVYADSKKAGSVAAPTAGLHFTSALLKKIKDKGVKIVEITLYVGMGTFAPVKVDDFKKHKMHAEWVEINREAINQLKVKSEKFKNGRIIAVGTTSCRALEACFSNLPKKGGFKDWVDIFIYPGYKFKVVAVMITNFHLPKSTLLMLVSALAGKKNIDKAYKEAVKQKYKFYSYGDAMLIK